jgi:hypothetical protein
VAARLRPGARIYLDDAHRVAETRTSANWLRLYPNLRRVDQFDGGHGVHVFEVGAPLPRPRFDWRVFLNHLRTENERLLNNAWTRLNSRHRQPS